MKSVGQSIDPRDALVTRYKTSLHLVLHLAGTASSRTPAGERESVKSASARRSSCVIEIVNETT